MLSRFLLEKQQMLIYKTAYKETALLQSIRIVAIRI